MSRALLAFGLTLVLLAGILTAWWFVGTPTPADQAGPGPASTAESAGSGDDLYELGDTAEARRESRSPGGAESSSTGGPPDPDASFSIEVAVVDPHDQPVGNARVWIEDLEGSEVVTDERGLARLELPSGTRGVGLWVEADGYVHTRDWVFVVERVEVVLYPATRVRGRVVESETRAGLENAHVWLDLGHEDSEPRGTRTAADGSFELEQAPVGIRFDVRAAADGFADTVEPFRLLEDSEIVGLEIELERGAGLRLHVVDFLTGRPVQGARLLSVRDPTPADERGVIDASRMVAESAESTWISLGAPGYSGLRRRLTASEWSDGGMVTIPLLPGARFEGVVRDGAGTPVSSAQVRARPRSGVLRARLQTDQTALEGWSEDWLLSAESRDSVVTDAQGRFVTPGVPPTTPDWVLEVTGEGLAEARVDVGRAPDPGQSTWVEVLLEPVETGTVRGLLRLNGAPVAGLVTWRGTTSEGRGQADLSGRFRLEGVEIGEVALGAVPRDGQRDLAGLFGEIVSVQVAAGQEVDQDIDLELSTALTSGHARTHLGDGVEGVEVVAVQRVEVAAIRRSGRASLVATSSDEGRFELELPTGPEVWDLQVRGPWRTEAIEARAGDRDLVLTVTELGLVRLRLVDAGGDRPLRDFEVRGSAPGTPGSRILAATWQNTPDPAGWVEFEAPSGTMDLVARAHDRSYPPAQAQVLVPRAGAPPLKVELNTAHGSALELVLAADSDRPPRRSRMYLLDEDVAARLAAGGTPDERWAILVSTMGSADSLRGRSISFDRQGRTMLQGLPGGRYRLVDLGRGEFEPARVEIPRDAGAPFEVIWEDLP